MSRSRAMNSFPAKLTPDTPTDLTRNKKLSRTTLFTEKYCTFWNGPLSNWHLGTKFSGKRCMELLLPRLDESRIPHPAADAFSTRLIAAHWFICGEQFMMAAKAWVFEDMSSVSSRKLMDKCTLPKILDAAQPSEQKDLGRKVQGYRDVVWQQASRHVVVAGSISRAEQDSELRELYRNIGNRLFVEGSPSDWIWGVGLKFDDPLIDDERNWKGENRLGKCHDEAARFIRATALTHPDHS